MQYLSLYLEYIKVNMQSIMEERKAFIWESIAQMSSYVAQAVLIWVLVNTFKSINGWGSYEVMFLYALNVCTYAIAGFFFYIPCTTLPTMVQTGRFDEVLTKPLNSLVYLACSQFCNGYVRHVMLSFVIMGICIYKLSLSLAIVNILFLILTILSGALIQAAAFLFASVPSFWVVKTDNLFDVYGEIRGFIQYPISVYNITIQVFLTLIVPFAFINFYPAQFFLKKSDFLMFHPIFQFVSPIVGILLFAGAYRFWKAGINNYQSTGS